MSTVAIAAYLFVRGSSGWVAAYFLVALGVRVVAGPAAGRLADLISRRRLVVAADGARALLMSGLALMLFCSAPLWSVVAAVGTSNLLAAIHRPAFAAMTVEVVPPRLLPRANSADGAVHQIGWTLGPALGAVIASVGTPALAVGANAASFVVAGVLAAGVRVRTGATGRDRSEPEPDRPVDVQVNLGMLMVLLSAAMTMFGAEFVLLIAIAEHELALGPTGSGYLLAAIGIGGVFGSWWASRLYKRAGPTVSLTLATALSAALLGVFGLTSVVVALLVLAVKGAVDVVGEVAMTSGIQSIAPTEQLGSVFGRVDAVSASSQLIGIASAAALTEWLSPARSALVIALVILASCAGVAVTAVVRAAGSAAGALP